MDFLPRSATAGDPCAWTSCPAGSASIKASRSSIEATGLYRLEIHRIARPANDAAILHAIRTLDTSQLHAHAPNDLPYHFDVVMNPYPVDGANNWFATVMYKLPAGNAPFASPLPGIPRTTVDTMGIIASLVDAFGGGLIGTLTRSIVGKQIGQRAADCSRPTSR